MKSGWKEYIEEQYDVEKNLEEVDVQDDYEGPPVLYSEFEHALEELKNKKATGPDGIPAELFKALGYDGKKNYSKFVMKYICVMSGRKTSRSIKCSSRVNIFDQLVSVCRASKIVVKVINSLMIK